MKTFMKALPVVTAVLILVCVSFRLIFGAAGGEVYGLTYNLCFPSEFIGQYCLPDAFDGLGGTVYIRNQERNGWAWVSESTYEYCEWGNTFKYGTCYHYGSKNWINFFPDREW